MDESGPAFRFGASERNNNAYDDGKPEPTIIVYGFADTVAALEAAAGLKRTVRLKSPFVVAASLGPQGAWSMFKQASAAVPQAIAAWVLDCGDDPGLALAALRAGVPDVQVAPSDEAYARLADVAAQLGIRISEDEEGAPVLDLANIDDPIATCRQWLKSLRNGLDCSRMSDCQC
jgi:hypothetical protein